MGDSAKRKKPAPPAVRPAPAGVPVVGGLPRRSAGCLRACVGIGLLVAMVVRPQPAYALKYQMSEEELCRGVDWAFIGKVIEISSEYRQLSVGNLIVSDLDIRVERFIHGAPQPVTRLTVPGGTVGGRTMIDMEGMELVIGSRQLFLVATEGTRSELMVDRALRRTFALRRDVELPPEALLQAIWVEHCGPSGKTTEATPGGAGRGDPGSSPLGSSPAPLRPTEGFIKFLPAEFRDWCNHH